MATTHDIVRLALDIHSNSVSGNFSNKDANESLRQALVELNGGSTKLDIKKIRNGGCGELFAVIEEVTEQLVIEGLQGNEFFMSLVDFRNIKKGDAQEFVVPDNSLFFVAETADGTQGVRRQRLNGATKVAIKTSLKTVSCYEELNRVLAGRVDFNDFIDKVSASFTKKTLDDIYKVWSGITTVAGSKYFPVAGAFSETALLEMIDHVEAANGGKQAIILGTRPALRAVTQATVSESAKEAMNSCGYYGVFNGTPMVRIANVHATGTDDFVLDDKKLYVIAGDIKPIKFVTEGESLLLMGDPLKNADFSQEFFYGSAYGVGLLVNEKFGVYTLA